jgi:hypothetical protein
VVVAAIGLVAAAFLAGVVQVTLINLAGGSIHVAFGIVFVMLGGSLWIYGLCTRRNWVRWLTVIWAGIGALGMIWGVSRFSDPWQVLIERIQGITFVAAALLLCLRASRDWYGQRNVR